ncbi:MAG TPA: holo-ACP synthase [Rhodocyclaceae bacterium]|nr:holo-ACP synthase [Rhodocyclaceae bacterium]
MIYGIGTDIVSVARMAGFRQRHGERALNRVLAPEEHADCLANVHPDRFLARRFAAKEALSKALGTGLRAPVLLTAIAIGHDEFGKPCFNYSPELAAHIDERRLTAHLSISDEHDYAVAFVVLERQ